jgi:hypothetical protein
MSLATTEPLQCAQVERCEILRIFRTSWDVYHLSSRHAYRFYLGCLAILLTSGVALRMEAAFHGRRIISVVTALSTLRIGETSKAETLSRIPTLRPSEPDPHGGSRCDADECFSMGAGNGLPGRLLWKSGNNTLLRWWGLRYENLNVHANFTSGKVSYFSYLLYVSAPGVPQPMPPPPRDGELGLVVVGLSSRSIINSRVPNSTVAEHPPYRLTPARSTPSQSIGIALTPNAPAEVVRAAFDLKLGCLWSFGGCRRWNELLPAVQPLIRWH